MAKYFASSLGAQYYAGLSFSNIDKASLRYGVKRNHLSARRNTDVASWCWLISISKIKSLEDTVHPTLQVSHWVSIEHKDMAPS